MVHKIFGADEENWMRAWKNEIATASWQLKGQIHLRKLAQNFIVRGRGYRSLLSWMASWEFSSKNNVPKEIKELVGIGTKWKSFLEKGKTNCLLFVVGNVQLNLCINEYHAKRRGLLSLAMERVTYSHSIMLFSVDFKFDIIDAEIIIEWFSIKKAFIMESQNLSKHTKLSTQEQGSAIWSGYLSII